MLLADTPFLRIQADVEPILDLGRTPYGERRVVPIRAGRFEVSVETGTFLGSTTLFLCHNSNGDPSIPPKST